MAAKPTILSKRLGAIDQAITADYHHIWDCCCDHGYLGQHLFERNAAPNIHCVDIVPHIMSKLQARLAEVSNESSQFHTHCLDVAKLPLSSVGKGKKHLIIIAGVGGDLTLSMVEQLLDANPQADLDFILCPLRQQYHLRHQLSKRGLKLIDEQLIKDDKLFYEIIHLSSTKGEPIEGVGTQLWRQPSAEHLQHLTVVLGHFKRMANNPDNDISQALKRYEQLYASLMAWQESR